MTSQLVLPCLGPVFVSGELQVVHYIAPASSLWKPLVVFICQIKWTSHALPEMCRQTLQTIRVLV